MDGEPPEEHEPGGSWGQEAPEAAPSSHRARSGDQSQPFLDDEGRKACSFYLRTGTCAVRGEGRVARGAAGRAGRGRARHALPPSPSAAAATAAAADGRGAAHARHWRPRRAGGGTALRAGARGPPEAPPPDALLRPRARAPPAPVQYGAGCRFYHPAVRPPAELNSRGLPLRPGEPVRGRERPRRQKPQHPRARVIWRAARTPRAPRRPCKPTAAP
jgi:hypothetical protein